MAKTRFTIAIIHFIMFISTCSVFGVADVHTDSRAAGVWTLIDAVCPSGCGPGYLKKIQDLKGKQLILTTSRYVDPINGTAACNTGVDFKFLNMQPGISFVKNIPTDDESPSANNFDPASLDVSKKKILAGILVCRGAANLATIFMPTDQQLDMVLEGGVFAIFQKSN